MHFQCFSSHCFLFVTTFPCPFDYTVVRCLSYRNASEPLVSAVTSVTYSRNGQKLSLVFLVPCSRVLGQCLDIHYDKFHTTFPQQSRFNIHNHLSTSFDGTQSLAVASTSCITDIQKIMYDAHMLSVAYRPTDWNSEIPSGCILHGTRRYSLI